VKVLYIAGTGRSGTTVLDRILGQLDGFFSAGELENIWHRGVLADRKCGCGVPFSRCPVWRAVPRRAFGGLDGVVASRMATLGRRHTGPRSIPATLAGRVGRTDPGTVLYREGPARLYQAVQQETSCGVIVDSSNPRCMPSSSRHCPVSTCTCCTWSAIRGRRPTPSSGRRSCATSATRA
jgi:hypothetical protein